MKVRVPLWGKPQGYAVLDGDATKGATLGVNVYRADGSVVTEADLNPPIAEAPVVGRTLWELVQKIPAIITSLAGLSTNGILRNVGSTISALSITQLLDLVAGTPAKGDLIVRDASAYARIAAPAAGLVLTGNGVGALPSFQAAGSSIWTAIKKTVNQSRASTTTLADDSVLVVALAATTSYRIRARLFYQVANPTMDIKITPAYTGTTTALVFQRRVNINAGVMADNVGTVFATVTPNFAAAGSGVGYAEFDLYITTNTAGTFSIQWAQNVSDPANADMLAGSFIEYATF